ncbi:LysR family transcriptional regulator [Maridesulfovibrio zosterae]|uniref:LysR family transcriptional regulator n=1 Tax=Maridesulfovibrio zosterae TaxID=82171 RepID=UPI0004281B6F|nr:LysR family transcriptional regulator [Maridesulfovibrio zosterae]
MRINLNQLRCFYLAAKFKSVSKAAEALFVTPSAVTMQIKKLERWIGIRMLVREGNNIKLTPDAEEIYAQAKKVFNEAEVLELHIEKIINSHKGELVIGAHYILGKYILPNLVALIKKMHPKLNVKIVLDYTPQLTKKLQTSELDFIVTASLNAHPQIKKIPLFSDEMLLVVLKDSKHVRKKRIQPHEISSIPLILPERNLYLIDEYFEYHDIIPNVAMDNITADVIKQFVMQDTGGAILVRFTVEDELERGVFQEIKVDGGLPIADFGLAYLDKKTLSQEVSELLFSIKNNPFRRDKLV